MDKNASLFLQKRGAFTNQGIYGTFNFEGASNGRGNYNNL